mgnify:CR=1 FL=1
MSFTISTIAHNYYQRRVHAKSTDPYGDWMQAQGELAYQVLWQQSIKTRAA